MLQQTMISTCKVCQVAAAAAAVRRPLLTVHKSRSRQQQQQQQLRTQAASSPAGPPSCGISCCTAASSAGCLSRRSSSHKSEELKGNTSGRSASDLQQRAEQWHSTGTHPGDEAKHVGCRLSCCMTIAAQHPAKEN
jgi:hypothetical protein